MKIDKNEKGPLQRFKNQNLLLRKFGETALAVYRAIDGKRTFDDLQRDLTIESDKLQEIIDFMAENEMVIIDKQKIAAEDVSSILGKKNPKRDSGTKIKEDVSSIKNNKIKENLEKSEYELKEDDSELQPKIFEDDELKKLKEDLEKKDSDSESKTNDSDFEIKPEFDFDNYKEDKDKEAEHKKKFESETKYIDEYKSEDDSDSEKTDSEQKNSDSEKDILDSDDSEKYRKNQEKEDVNKDTSEVEINENNEFDFENKLDLEEEKRKKQQENYENKANSDDIENTDSENTTTNIEDTEKTDANDTIERELPDEYKETSAESSLSPVEKIIFDKYGQLGLKVYTLIDGQRTAEEIMRETGLVESKLVEMLDFMDEQGIIKLDYPKSSSSSSSSSNSSSSSSISTFGENKKPLDNTSDYAEKSSFNPLLENENPDEAAVVPSPLEIPTRAQLDLFRGIQLKAKVLLKYGEKGNKVLDMTDGKNDLIDISFKTNFPLYLVFEIEHFLIENGMVVVRPLQRTEVRKKYGDAAYSVYKRYGKEGLMLYELIGKDMSLKEMADKITLDKNKIIEMFVFIQSVLGMEGRVDKEAIAKQLQ